jgi:hypothetical protein
MLTKDEPSNRFALAVCVLLLLSAAPGWAGSLQIFEGSLGAPGVTAQFPTGNGLTADIDFDASSAEGGGLSFGASEITIVPLGAAVLRAFTCQLAAGCTEGVDYVFTPGGAGVGRIIVNDSDINPKNEIFNLVAIRFPADVQESR